MYLTHIICVATEIKPCIFFLLKTGLRISEAIELEWRSVNLMTGQVIVLKGKGSKDRIVYIFENMIFELSLWKERQCTERGNAEHVFTNRYCNKLDDYDVRERVLRYSRKAGIEKRLTPHVLRHTFASELLR